MIIRIHALSRSHRCESGSVFVLVLWISFGLVVLALYFANSMNFEVRSADNRYAAAQADAATAGAARYASLLIRTLATNGVMPYPEDYVSQWVPVGEASFWFLGEYGDEEQQQVVTIPAFGLIDESAKLNLNTATASMLEWLPGMTPEFAAAIVDWRDIDSEVSENGAEDESYQRLNPARRCKNGRFESVDELRLVYGATIEMLYGEDVNRNGILDPNENDGDASLPLDNADGRLDLGIAAYVTVHSRQLNTTPDGAQRVNVNNRQQLTTLLNDRFGTARASEIISQLPPPNQQLGSILAFYERSQMSAAEFAQIEDGITASNDTVLEGLINVNTASRVVLAAVPGIGEEKANELVSYRQSNPSQLGSLAWVKEVLDRETINTAGRYLTGRTYQFTADVVAVGRHNRGFRRTRFVFDATQSTPRIVYRQDLTQLGWALGSQVRENLELQLQARR